VTSGPGRSGGVAVTVTDAGPGIAHDDAERVFEPFFTTKPDGMGMGLAISRSLVESHGGHIEAAPAPAGGTTFRFTLPPADPGSRADV